MTAENKLAIGQTAPAFVLEAVGGRVSLEDLLKKSERGVIVYFYPKAGTPGCTKEACDFEENLGVLQASGYQVVGISPDSVPALERFQEKHGFTFQLASDPDHLVMTQWGTWGEKKNYGKTYIGVIRSTFVVGTDGKIVVANYNVKATGHVARLRLELGLS